MKRGVRPIWRELAQLAQKVADSKDYAEEYVYKGQFQDALKRMERLSRV